MRVVRLACCIALMFTMGCGGDDLPTPERVESLITVIDDSGTEREIPSSTLIDTATGEPTAKQVFVVDRQSNRKQFLDVSTWLKQSPSQLRYVPVSKNQPGTE